MKATNKVIKVLRSDRNEVRYHVSTKTVTVLYKNRKWLPAGWNIAQRMVGVR